MKDLVGFSKSPMHQIMYDIKQLRPVVDGDKKKFDRFD